MIACGNRNTFDATGTFEAVTVTISAQSTGRIVSFNAAEGDKLNAGDADAVGTPLIKMIYSQYMKRENKRASEQKQI